MNMIKLTCSDNINSRLTGDIGKKPNLENPVYSNNPSSILTDAMGLARASLVSKGFNVIVNT